MITFTHSDYIIPVFIAGALAIALHIFYSIWRRMAIASTIGGRAAAKRIIAGVYSRIIIKEILILLAITVSCVTLIGPAWGDRLRENTNEGTDVLIALDVSMSMLAKDVTPSRLERAKSAARLIAESVDGGRIGLIVFAGDAFLQCPLTADKGAFMMFLDSASPDSVRVQGTDIGRMLSVAERVYTRKRLTSKMLIVITDGEDHEGGVDLQAEKFSEIGVSVYAVGLGGGGELIPSMSREDTGNFYRDKDGVLIKTVKNEGLLKNLASKTGGFYTDITGDLSGIGKILSLIGSKEKTSFGSKMIKEKIDRTYIFIIILIILLAAEMLVSERKRQLRAAVNGKG